MLKAPQDFGRSAEVAIEFSGAKLTEGALRWRALFRVLALGLGFVGDRLEEFVAPGNTESLGTIISRHFDRGFRRHWVLVVPILA